MICLFFAADRMVAFILGKLRPIDYKLFVESRLDFFENDKNYDMLFIGDSHLSDALDTRIIEEKCNLSAYNLAIYHATPFDNYYFLQYILKKSKRPKFIILGTNPAMFRKQVAPSKYIPVILDDFFIRFRMRMNSVSKMDESLILKSVNERELIKPIFKNLCGIEYKPTRIVTKVYNGYLESGNQTLGFEWENYDLSKSKSSTKKVQINYLHQLIDLAKFYGIKVIIVNPPIWERKLIAYKEQNRTYTEYQTAIADIKNNLHVPVFNEANNLLHAKLVQRDYLDPEHLNYYGAKKFTYEFVNWFNNNKNAF